MVLIKILGLCGMLSSIIYTLMWVIIGSMQSDYNHIRDDISSLFAVEAPHRRIAQSFIITSSILCFIFFIGLHEGLQDGGRSLVGPILFLVSSFSGIIVALFFPLDAGGEIKTIRGKMHLILVASNGVLQIIGMLALWIRLESVPEWHLFAIYSLISAIISIILVIISSISAQGKYRGIVERIGVTPYELYYFILGLLLFLNN
ncbi:MAG: DUF998 domain-containing protein [Candidatus Lokiarchaeota archaeon]|nr:DUF998 domain-containing protein [Candidatus Lokiarchaeota archaeon]